MMMDSVPTGGRVVRKPRYYIFRAYITRQDGSRDYARDHGMKAWKIPIY